MDPPRRGWTAAGFGSTGTGNQRFSLARLSESAMSRRMNEEYGGHPEEGVLVPPPIQEQQGVAAPQQGATQPPPTGPPVTTPEQQQLMAAIQGQGDFATALAAYQRAHGDGGGAREAIPTITQPEEATADVPPPQQQQAQEAVTFAPDTRLLPPPAAQQVPPSDQQQQQPGLHQQPPGQPGQQQQPPPSAHRQGSLAAAALRFEPLASSVAYINDEIKLQQNAAGGARARDDYRDAVLTMPTLECSAFMFVASGGKTPRIDILHSPTKYWSLSVATHLNGAYIGFVGDRSSVMNPTPVKLQAKKAFDWATVRCTTDRADINVFYADAANASKFYTIPDGADTTTETYPNMCLIPMSLLPWLTEKSRTVNEVRVEVERRAADQPLPTPSAPAVDWDHIIRWLVAASHDDSTGNGRLTLNHEHLAGLDEGFFVWMNTRLQHRLGDVTTAAPPAAATGAPSQSIIDLQRQMLNTTTLALQAAQQSNAAAAQTAPTAARAKSSSGGHEYEDYELAALMAFSGIDDPKDIQPIWHEFQYTSNYQSHRDIFKFSIDKYAEAHGIIIDRNIDFSKQWIQKLVRMEFSSGATGASYRTLGKGLDMLAFLPYKKGEIAENREKEKRLDETKATRTYDEQERHDTKGPRKPADNFDKLKRNWATTFVALRVLLGPSSPLVMNFRDGLAILSSKKVLDDDENFSVRLCREITFHACDDMTYFFSQRVPVEFFDKGPPYVWPNSLLHQIFRALQFQEAINRSNFPREWETGDRYVSGLTEQSFQALITSVSSSVARDQTAELRRQVAALQRAAGAGQVAPPASRALPTTGSGESPSRTTRPREPFTLSEIHEGLHDLMSRYHGKFEGRILWKDICESGNFSRAQLPTLPQYMKDDKSTICWVDVLGRCSRPDCRFDHPKHHEMDTESFLEKTIALVKNGVDYVCDNRTPYTEEERKRLRPSGRGRGRR